MSTREERQVADLKERVARLTGELTEHDLHLITIYAIGDADEHTWCRPALRGRYTVFSAKQKRDVARFMEGWGYTRFDDHWQRLLTSEQMAERDKNDAPLTPEELVSDEDREPVVQHGETPVEG